jgi:hypothetical protein
MSYLPGQILPVHKHDVCSAEGHETRPAVRKVVGEVDSFGPEIDLYCKECAEALDAMPEKDTSGDCEWCKGVFTELVSCRDIDEGSGGPVYMVCRGCRTKQDKEAWAELNSYCSTED